MTTHGLSQTPEYRIWLAMRQRCENPNSSHYADYGGRGISLCPRWRDFETFLADMGARPSPKHSIDRINNNGRYEPANCRWATQQEQLRNTRPHRDGTSGLKGVAFHRASNKWRAYITTGGKTRHIGLFPDASSAVAARREAEQAEWGRT